LESYEQWLPHNTHAQESYMGWSSYLYGYPPVFTKFERGGLTVNTLQTKGLDNVPEWTRSFYEGSATYNSKEMLGCKGKLWT